MIMESQGHGEHNEGSEWDRDWQYAYAVLSRFSISSYDFGSSNSSTLGAACDIRPAYVSRELTCRAGIRRRLDLHFKLVGGV